MNTPTLEYAPPAPISLRITEIFLSLQGESRSVGWPTAFIRLTGCPLRCGYCDTAYAFTGGRVMPLEDILARVQDYGVHHVCVTGGEPLAQPDCLPLLAALCDAGHEVSLETSGALDISAVDPRAIKVMDLKTPGSGEVARNLWENLAHLSSHDQVKFVIRDRADYDWAREVLTRYGLADRVEVLFSVAFGDLAPGTLADWIVEDHLPVRFQLQLHKVLWNDARGR
ncbi:7-carboxy-7-deazaguanine synthase QueE [Ectothiorhodospira variabilis]|uniref:7-carboxy-7-deazaguanine synthase QueE n=1 Tax=Ectothiorhodospira variabilis TaxID=505694 RepID=UPI001EFBE2F0|nr:7-carboxy-7-deazaguanine synthase QueE [Ectothiorhodospira variabilis]MCG5496679.1 7-carboxy-7-deazaguanine synthase QueE [Ectothiorhodospira variabilis]